MNKPSPGARFRQAMAAENPLQIAGVINAYAAMLAQRSGFKAIYLSGAGVANASYGLPDLAMTTLNDVCTDVKRITDACGLPLLVDADTGWGNAFMIARTIKQIAGAGAAGCHLEDQVQAKRCGHRPNKALVSTGEMCDRIKAAVDAREDADFVIMARTDAAAGEGIDAAMARARAYAEAGADMIFAEALTSAADYSRFTGQVEVPVLANMTEFGKSPLLSVDELAQCGVQLILYPLSAFRAMNRAALEVFAAIRRDGTQKALLDRMQTREELYEVLDYHGYETRLDQMFGKESDED